MVQLLRGSGAAVVGSSPPDDPIWAALLIILTLAAAIITTVSSDRGAGGDEEGGAEADGPGGAAGAGRTGDIEEGLGVYRPIPSVPNEGGSDPPNLPPPEAGKKTRVLESVAHKHFVDKSLMFFHLDVEDGGPQCGIVQLSVVVMNGDRETVGEFDRYVKPPSNVKWSETACAVHGLSAADPRIASAHDIVYVWREFHHFVESHLPDGKVGMLVAWNGRGSDMSKLFQVTEILYRGVLEMPKGLQFFCDPMRTIEHYKSCPLHETRRPSKVAGYGLDVVYQEATGRRIKDDFEGGAHNSLNDARAQAKIFADLLESIDQKGRVINYIDKNESVVTMDEVWRGKWKRRAEQAEEPQRQVPRGYTDSNLEYFEIPRDKRYTGPAGGGRMGPSSSVTEACRSRKLSDLFLYFITPEMLQKIARETNRYANETWVRPVSKEEYLGWKVNDSNDSDADDDFEGAERTRQQPRRSLRKPKKKKAGAPATNNVEIDLSAMTLEEGQGGEQKEGEVPQACETSSAASTDSDYSLELDAMSVDSDGSYDHVSDDEAESDGDDDDDKKELKRAYYVEEPKQRARMVECTKDHPEARKRYKGSQEWVDVTQGQMMAFYGILCIKGALGLRTWHSLYEEEEGFNSTFIQNAMPRDRFDQIVRYMHFVNNHKLLPKKHPRWHPLQKIQPFTDDLLKNIRRAYVMGQNMAVDESMIRYKGRAIKFVQYMPAKPIKHGIKVFALSCAETGYLYGFYVYTGADNDGKTKVEIVEELLSQDSDFIGNSAGRVLYTDNYYTSEELMKALYVIYGMFLVGTLKLTPKKSRTEDDFAFHELSPAAKKKVGRGWIRCAQKKADFGIVQNTTWMDRKQVGVMHNWLVGPPGTAKTLRYDRKAGMRVPVSTHAIVPDYVAKMRGVDMSDQGMSDYDITLKSDRWYLSIGYYDANAAFLDMRVITKLVVGQAEEQWRHDRAVAPDVPDLSAKFADPWLKYTREKTWANRKWTLDMGKDLIEAGILLDWGDVSDPTKKPKWVRQAPFLPCLCTKTKARKNPCFFCKHNLTSPTGPRKPEPKSKPSHKRSRSTPPTTAKHRNKIVEVECSHHYGTKPLKLFDFSRDCGVCIEEGRTRKPPDVVKDDSNKHLYINSSTLGCPHVNCRARPVCKEHWVGYKHK